MTGSRKRDVDRWTNVGGPISVCGRTIYSSSEVPISRMNTEGVVQKIRRIANSPPDPDAEGRDELDGEEIPKSHYFQHSQNLPTNFFYLSNFSSTTRPALILAVRQTPIPQSRNYPIATSQQLQPVASSSRQGEEPFPFPFPAAQVFQKRESWPIQVTREDPNTVSENQDAVARLFRTVDRNSRELSEYANDRTIPGTASEEMAEKFSWYEDELINDLQKTFDHLGRDS
ncbi:hypothetical protein O181_022292 [Austropuccinia psidii MF-1]|uniref:Uncharacterized protein n=1 Tax=Austropuccinia psidii MF-1 TaxID=1389203 RepID=A0A9Q3GWZ9_9BASI|nr:hypothetical protein [Austropuccinia psidii MF-1]